MIELSKGQELALIGDDGHPLTRLQMGVGWDRARNAGFIGSGAPDIDLDASAVSFGDGQLLDAAFYNHLESRDGSVVHLGDNLTALSHAFAVSESLMALRIAECLGYPTALVTARRVRTRGRKRDWPTSPDGWTELLAKADRNGLVVHRLRDARERVVLVGR